MTSKALTPRHSITSRMDRFYNVVSDWSPVMQVESSVGHLPNYSINIQGSGEGGAVIRKTPLLHPHDHTQYHHYAMIVSPPPLTSLRY